MPLAYQTAYHPSACPLNCPSIHSYQQNNTLYAVKNIHSFAQSPYLLKGKVLIRLPANLPALATCLSTCLLTYLPTCFPQPTHLPAYLPGQWPPAWAPEHLPACLAAWPPTCQPANLPTELRTHLFACLAHLAYRDTFADNFKQIGYQYLVS